MLKDKDDAELRKESLAELAKAEETLREFELAKMLSGKHDMLNAIVEINPGAGGTESQDWAEMLLRMYCRWSEKKGFSVQTLNAQPGDEAGIKNATLLIEGENAFGFFRSERGVHRLFRISPFASVSVVPEVDDSVDVQINEEDLRVDTYRASGAGGQHVNKTDSAVRITHTPTGTVAACQNSRSQHKNKDACMKLLKAKLYELEMEKKRTELEGLHGEKRKIDFGSQIRSYVLQPYQLIKDLRTECETGNVQAVLDGELESFVEAYLLSEHNISD